MLLRSPAPPSAPVPQPARPSPHHTLSLLGIMRCLLWLKQRTLSYSLDEGLCPLRASLSVLWVPSWGPAVRAAVSTSGQRQGGRTGFQSDVRGRLHGIGRGWPAHACVLILMCPWTLRSPVPVRKGIGHNLLFPKRLEDSRPLSAVRPFSDRAGTWLRAAGGEGCPGDVGCRRHPTLPLGQAPSGLGAWARMGQSSLLSCGKRHSGVTLHVADRD